jgi:hypothetical protein
MFIGKPYNDNSSSGIWSMNRAYRRISQSIWGPPTTIAVDYLVVAGGGGGGIGGGGAGGYRSFTSQIQQLRQHNDY